MMEDRVDSLEAQIREARRSIASDGYPMSIGELTNLYRDGELIIRPEFQRLFRWSDQQKSNLVESLLLGIPLPSIFVAQAESGVWELVDGLQRVSTILQLQGELLDHRGERVAPLRLLGTKYLPALEGRVWSDSDQQRSLSEAQRLDIKRSKLDIKIIKRESSVSTKYDLFQRLNSYGSPLTAQEVRSALLVAVSPDFFSWLERLASFEPFAQCVLLPDRLLDERYDLELVLRFLVLHNRPEDQLTMMHLRSFSQVLDSESLDLATAYPEGIAELESVFKQTFSYIHENGGEAVLRRWDLIQGMSKGAFLNTAFEVIAMGLGYHIANGNEHATDLLGLVRWLWSQPQMLSGFATGRSTEARLAQFVKWGRKITDGAFDRENADLARLGVE